MSIDSRQLPLPSTSYRSHGAGDLRAAHAGQSVRLAGWVHRVRDLGGLVFVELRDRSGRVQATVDASAPGGALARSLHAEDVVQVEGTVVLRPEAQRNPDLPTGAVEVRIERLVVLARAAPLPIPVARSSQEGLPAEDLRLRYRMLDLRRPEMQRHFAIRHAAAQVARRVLTDLGFWEVETPLLTRPTPEGARDFLVPSRLHPGEFYALPQSPQLYKQILMVAGFDRYFQLARCLRDEDLRADRQPEFTQIDLEMAFADEEDVVAVAETLLAALWREILDVELVRPFPRLSYAEALRRYGTDKPDLRWDAEIVDVTDVLQASDVPLFAATRGTPQRIRGLRVADASTLTRRDLEDLTERARSAGAPGLLWLRRQPEGFGGPMAKALVGREEAFLAATGLAPGDLFLALVGPFWPHPDGLDRALGEVRRAVGERLGRFTAAHRWVWVTDFPLFEWDAEAQRLVAAHHPFTAPHPEDLPRLPEPTAASITPEELLAVRSRAYDTVYNGHELASGSVRIHDAEVQRRVFRALGIAPDEADRKFGFLLEAFRYGAPPHAGCAFGFDRLVMLLAGATNLRDVIAFPKTTSARALFEGAPVPVDPAELAELHLRILEEEVSASRP